MSKLREICEAATPGPWYVGKSNEISDPLDPTPDSCPITPYPDQEGKNPYEDTLAEFWDGNYLAEANARFCATFNPARVLRMVEALEKVHVWLVCARIASSIDSHLAAEIESEALRPMTPERILIEIGAIVAELEEKLSDDV